MAENFWSIGLGHILAVTAILAAVILYFAVELGKEEEYRRLSEAYKKKLNKGRWKRFRKALEGLLKRIDKFFGYSKTDDSIFQFWRPWSRCLTIAFVYPLFFFLITYVVAEKGDLGGVTLLNALLVVAPVGGEPITIDWMAMMAAFRDDPFGEGLTVTLMLFSTLVPTLFHLAAGTAALVKLPKPLPRLCLPFRQGRSAHVHHPPEGWSRLVGDVVRAVVSLGVDGGAVAAVLHPHVLGYRGRGGRLSAGEAALRCRRLGLERPPLIAPIIPTCEAP